MIELIFSIIFIISFAGVIFILYRKIPVLVTLPQNGSTGFGRHKLVLKSKDKARQFYIVFKKQIYLHKLLSKTKCWILKLETKIDSLLHKIRKEAQKVEKEFQKKK